MVFFTTGKVPVIVTVAEVLIAAIVLVPGCVAVTVQTPGFKKFKVDPLTEQTSVRVVVNEMEPPLEAFASSFTEPLSILPEIGVEKVIVWDFL